MAHMNEVTETVPRYPEPIEQQMTRPGTDGFRKGIEQVVAILALCVLFLPLAATALVTWCVFGSPVFFRQLRMGQGGKNFTIYKFRTMHDTRDETGKLLPDRERVTAFSRFLRKIRLDELPQLFAIAGGKMAFIGPRPLLPETIHSMGRLGELRCRVRPGLSGWAQINGNTQLTNSQKLCLDVWYIDNRNLILDLLIVWKTLLTVMRGESVNLRNIAEAEEFVRSRYGSPKTSEEAIQG
jgi:lipopolysaccharide/colanic/teichoic acid biosynthesis glycosyltransferase